MLESTERRVTLVEVQMAELRADLRNHLIACDRRSAILQKLSWWILGLVTTALGLLLKTQLGLHL